MRRRLGTPLLLLLVALAVAGCLEGTEPVDGCVVPHSAPPTFVALPVADDMLQTDPGQPWDVLAWDRSVPSGPTNASFYATHLSLEPGWQRGAAQTLAAPDRLGALVRVRLDDTTQAGRPPTSKPTDGVRLNWTFSSGPGDLTHCAASGAGSIAFHPSATPARGQRAHPGQGVHVWYAGFWENGTLFDTNVKDIADAPWPHAGWYGANSFEPIPVYVYDTSRSEEPAYWKDPFAGTPAAGSPADGAGGLGYFTTIRGFNDALKDLSTTTTRVVRIEPSDAYPKPIPGAGGIGGSPLVFLIKIQDVVDAPCPSPLGESLRCTAPA